MITLIVFVSILLCLVLLVVYVALNSHVRRGFVASPNYEIKETYPIDAVFTWVDSNDDKWARIKRFYTSNNKKVTSSDLKRFGSEDISQIEIELSVKLLLENAPWVRNVYIVTADQVPDFMTRTFKNKNKVHVCSHMNIFSETITPTYNSHAIEANLHNIPGLSEHFLYLNDDFYITKPVQREDFFINGSPIYRGFSFANVKNRFFGKILKKCICSMNPDSDTFLESSSNVAEILGDGILCFRFNHNTTPMTKTMMFEGKNYLNSLNRYNYHRMRSPNDVPPIHFSALYALKNARAYYQHKSNYKVGFIDEFKGKIKNNCHEICINYLPNREKALELKSLLF